MSAGALPPRIPESRIREHFYRKGWPDDMVDAAVKIMLTVDRGYINWAHSERTRRAVKKK